MGGTGWMSGRWQSWGGELIGELSLLTGQPRLASVQMLRDTELACISAEVFQAALAQNPHLM